MNEEFKRILAMLADGKVTAAEAERLMDAINQPAAADAALVKVNSAPKYFRVEVDTREPGDSPTKVNVRVPMQLLRAGVRLAGLIPKQAHDQLDEAFTKHGVPITLSQIKPENLEELIDHLEDLTVDVDGKDGNSTRVKVFCE